MDDVKITVDSLLEQIEAVRLYDIPHAKKLCIQLMELSRKEKSLHGEAMAYYRHGAMDISDGECIRGLEYFSKAGDLFLKAGEYQNMAYVYNGAGLASRYQEDYTNALQGIKAALNVLKRYPDDRLSCVVHNNCGDVFMLIGNYKKAIYHFKKSVQLDEKAEYAYSKGVSRLNLGIVKGKMGNYRAAVKSLSLALPILERWKYYNGMEAAYEYLAINNYRSGKYRTALFNMAKALEYTDRFGADDDTYFSHYDFMMLLMELGETDIIGRKLEQDYRRNRYNGKDNSCALICHLAVVFTKQVHREEYLPRIYENFYWHSRAHREMTGRYLEVGSRLAILDRKPRE